LSLVVAVALIAFLYLAGNTVPPAKKPLADSQRPNSGGAVSPGAGAVTAISFDTLLAQSRARLSVIATDSLKNIEKEIAATRDSSRMAVLFTQLAKVWENSKQMQASAYFYSRAAKLENSEKKLTFAGQLFLRLMEDENSPTIQMADAVEAAKCLEQSLVLNPGSEDAKLSLATAYIEGTGEPMRGVQILLGIIREKPEDISANMLLGRMSVQSGQFDKAIGRFETVLKNNPQNKEAMFFMAQAFEGKGDKKKAIEMLEKCKKLVNDPQFSSEIDQKINSLK
jgi:tetratricopeptide (TPR) repeat protein